MRTILLLLSLICSLSHAHAADRPNILFIAVDDLRPELGCYGVDVKTPHIDKLAASGVRFDRAYCQQAVCGASRLSLMGGLYPTKTSEQTFHVDGWRKRHPDLITLNQHLRSQGYRTVGSGKIYHGCGGDGVDPNNWDEWIQLKAPNYALPESEQARKDNNAAHPNNKGTSYRGPTTENAPVEDDFSIDGKRARDSAKKLGELAAGEQPFFFAVGFIKPHLPFVAPKKYWDIYQRDDFSMPDNLGVPPGYPDYARNATAGEMRRYSDYEGKSPKDFSDDLNRRLLHGYAACVSYTDANVGILLDALEASGAADNTIVVFWGDHGWKLGDHHSWCKHTNFECDARVPLIVRSPNAKTETHNSDALVELIDLYPTLCELTGVPTPEHCQGKSFANMLAAPSSDHRDSAYSSYPHGKMIGHSVRFGSYRYTEWFDHKTGKPSADSPPGVLTDLVADPGEITNVADESAHAKALDKGKALLQQRIAAAVGE